MKDKKTEMHGPSSSPSVVMTEDYDLVIVGSGEPGKYLAWTLGGEGKRVAVVERKYVGGSCPNIACLPSKNFIHSAKVASYVRRAEEFGIGGPSDWSISMEAVRARKRTMVDGLVAMHLGKYHTNGVDLVLGEGRFVAPRTVEVSLPDGGTRRLQGENVVINVGSRAKVDETPGLQNASPLTHVEALDLGELPEHLLVLGGGYVGLELAQAFRRLGSRVTVVERNSALLHREDADVSDGLAHLFRDEGIEVSTGTVVERVTGRSGDEVHLHVTRDGSEVFLTGSHLLVAAGRTPNTSGIGLDAAGVETDARGFVKVDERLRTTADRVWAVGDCAGSPQFTHVAFDDFRIVRDTLAGRSRTKTRRLVPWCMFTDPELAHVGLSEREAVRQSVPYRLVKIPMTAIMRTWTLSEPRGFMKALLEANDDKVLGFTAFGVGAGEVMAAVQVAMTAGLPFTALRDSIFTHPTVAEGLVALFSAAPARD